MKHRRINRTRPWLCAVAGAALAALLACPAPAGEKRPALSRRDVETLGRRIHGSLLRGGVHEEASRLVETLRPDGSWPHVDYEDRSRSGWKTIRHLANVATLARSYRSPLDSPKEASRDDALLKAALASLDYWLERDFQNPNWWWNQIGVPRTLYPTLWLLEDALSDEQRRRGLEILGRAKIGMTGQNLVWVTEITAIRGLLEDDPALVAKAYRRIMGEIEVSMGEGIQPDFSFHQHGPCLYSHGYGAAFASDCSRVATQVAGTKLAFPQETIDVLAGYLLDGSQWMARASATDFGAEGREISRPGQSAGYLGTAAGCMLELPTGRADEFRDLATRSKDVPAPPLEGNRHFWRSDMMTHHRAGFYASARMYSRRTANTDAPCNDEGLKSHHVADGCNVLMRTGREYRDVFPLWDWQKIPGTTVEEKPELTGSPRRMGQRSFVGGVSDGTYGLAAFDHVRGPLAARKCWAFFDREYVCLGAGMTCGSENPVVTTVNQCRLEGPVTVAEGNAAREVDRGVHTLDGPCWVLHDRVGYVLLAPAQVHLKNDAQQGSRWSINHRYGRDPISHDMFTLWIDHGPGPDHAKYAYLVVPGVDAASLGAYAARPPVEIVRNEAELQAVWHRELGVACLAFYEPGRVAIRDDLAVGVDTPCLVLLRETPDGLALSVSNPKNEAAQVAAEVSGRWQGEAVEALDDGARSRATFDLPGGHHAGRSVTRTLDRR